MFHIDPTKSNLNQLKADKLVKEFEKLDMWAQHFGTGIMSHILLLTSISLK